MRTAAFALTTTLLTSAAWADTFTLESAPSAVTVYPSTAQITRSVTLSVPAGTHDLILPDLPFGIDPARLNARLSGGQIGAVAFRDSRQMPRPDADTPAITAARATVKAAQAALDGKADEIARVKLAVTAAQAQTDFLTALGKSEALPSDVETLRALAQMIGDQTLSAGTTAQDAQETLRALKAHRADLEDALDDAQAALNALLTAGSDRSQLTITATAPTASDITLDVSYVIRDAYWQPVYNMRLTTDGTPSLAMERGAEIAQNSGEDWTDVALTLATVLPSGQTQPSDVYAQIRRIEDPVMRKATIRMESALADSAAPAPMMESPVVVSGFTGANALLDGPSVQYGFPAPVSVANGADNLRIALGTLDFTPDLFARAVPLRDETAFRMVRLTNDSGEQLLASDYATAFVDGQMVGQFSIGATAPGAETDIAFGPIETLRLKRVRLDRNEGDRGIISRSNEITESTRIDVRNTGSKAWRVELLDRAPVSEQEDLTIEWNARPMPATQDYKDRKGVLLWNFDVAAGAESSIRLDVSINWPEGMILR